MKNIYIIFLVACLSLSSFVFPSDIQKESFYLPTEVKQLVDSTFSINAVERAEAAYQLGRIGIKSYKATPFLMRLLDDNIPVWCRYETYGIWTTPGQEAAKAIVEIGNPSLEYLLPLVEDNHPYISMNLYMEKNLIYALCEISGLDIGNDFERWSNWINSQKRKD